MERPPRHGDLELSEDFDFQQWEWRLQRIGRWLVLALVLAALAGLTGKGPLSHARRTSADGKLTLEYDRFLRHHDQTQLTFTIDAEGEGPVRLVLPDEYLAEFEILHVSPRPVRESTGGAGWLFEFSRDPGPASVVFYLQPLGRGSINGRATLDDGAQVDFWQFIYP